MSKFQVAQKFQATSACDHECVWTFTVLARTAKFVTLLEDGAAVPVRVGVRTWDGVEFCSPFGTYSMAPSLSADRAVA